MATSLDAVIYPKVRYTLVFLHPAGCGVLA